MPRWQAVVPLKVHFCTFAHHILQYVLLYYQMYMSVLNFLKFPLLTSENRTEVGGPIWDCSNVYLSHRRKPESLSQNWEFTVTTVRRKTFCWNRITEPVVTIQIYILISLRNTPKVKASNSSRVQKDLNEQHNLLLYRLWIYKSQALIYLEKYHGNSLIY